jgi:hypothetical protein
MFFKHVLFLFVLACLCYAIAVYFTAGRAAFIVFFVIGIVAELMFWISFWRECRISGRRRTESRA